MISQMNGGLVPFQTKGSCNLLRLGQKNDLAQISQNTSFEKINFIGAFDSKFKPTINKMLCYDKDSWDDIFKMSFLGGGTANSVRIKIDGRKNIKIRLKLINYTVENFPTSAWMNTHIFLKDGTMLEKHIENYKTDLENNVFQLDEFFLKDINDFFPFDDCIFELVISNTHIMIDGLYISDSDKTATASQLNSSIYKQSPVGATAFCTDRRKSTEDELGIMLMFDGTNWKTFDGVLLSNLVS